MRILHLEDSRADAELVEELLREEWPAAEIKLVSSKDEYVTQLRGGYDLILSDFSLAGFDGSEALQIAQQEVPDTPFIFLSGNIGEDRAIEAVRAGAHDYVLKDRTKRLVTAIRHALQESAERKRTRAIESERARLVLTLEALPDFVGHAAPDGRVLYLNRAARRMLRLPDDIDPTTLRIDDLHPPEALRHLYGTDLPHVLRDGSWQGENLLKTRDGHRIPVAQVIIAHRAPDGSLQYLSTVMRDLTARQQSEALVHGQNQILEMIAGGEPLHDTLVTLLEFIEGQAPEMICSVLVPDATGKTLRHEAAPRLPRAYMDAIDGSAIGPGVGSCGTAAYRRTPVVVTDIASDPLWDDFRHLALPHGLRACWSTPIFDPHHRLLGTFAVYMKDPGAPTQRHRELIDVGVHIASICFGRHQTERRLRDQADILHKAGDMIIVSDPQDRVTFWSASAARTLGWSTTEAMGRTLGELFGSSAAIELESARPAADRGEDWRGHLHMQDRNGKPLIMASRITIIRDEYGKPQGRLTIATDITEKRQIEEQFFRAQRMESLGMLAAGIAHDLNNVLAPILLAAPMLRDHATDPGDLRMIGTLEKSAERGAALVRQILGFAHGAEGQQRIVQAKHLLRDIATFIHETFPKSIQLQDQVPTDLWPVKANPTQLHQVLLNLCVNARDAMPDGGTLTLRGENISLTEQTAGELEGGRPGAYLVLHVQDTGTGIPADVLPRIWEPFFTTKGSGKGTGLGLPTVRGIVESHGGFVSVSTGPRRGTTFRIHFPAALESLPASTATAPVTFAAPQGSGQFILVVDDEPEIRNMSAAMLTRHGYRVLTASDGAEAVALFAPRAREIQLVVTDLSMPNLDGDALASVVRRLNPAVKIVAVSGHGQEIDANARARRFSDAFLVKPFRPESLLTTVHELLRVPANPPPPA